MSTVYTFPSYVTPAEVPNWSLILNQLIENDPNKDYFAHWLTYCEHMFAFGTHCGKQFRSCMYESSMEIADLRSAIRMFKTHVDNLIKFAAKQWPHNMLAIETISYNFAILFGELDRCDVDSCLERFGTTLTLDTGAKRDDKKRKRPV